MEQVFNIHFHGRIGYSDAYSMPVWKRQWFVKRLQTEFDRMYKK